MQFLLLPRSPFSPQLRRQLQLQDPLYVTSLCNQQMIDLCFFPDITAQHIKYHHERFYVFYAVSSFNELTYGTIATHDMISWQLLA